MAIHKCKTTGKNKYRNNLSIEIGTDQQVWIVCCLKVLKELAIKYINSLTGFFLKHKKKESLGNHQMV